MWLCVTQLSGVSIFLLLINSSPIWTIYVLLKTWNPCIVNNPLLPVYNYEGKISEESRNKFRISCWLYVILKLKRSKSSPISLFISFPTWTLKNLNLISEDSKTNLFVTIFVMILLLDEWAEEESSIVYEVGRVLCQVQHQKIEIQAHNTARDWH